MAVRCRSARNGAGVSAGGVALGIGRRVHRLGQPVQRRDELGSGTFVIASSGATQSIGDVTELMSPLQLIEARFAVEPYTTRLAAIRSMMACARARSSGGSVAVWTT